MKRRALESDHFVGVGFDEGEVVSEVDVEQFDVAGGPHTAQLGRVLVRPLVLTLGA